MNFPEQGPMCYVTPTSTMLVKAGKHVDANGRVYHPQLAHWTPNVTLYFHCFERAIAHSLFNFDSPHYAPF